MPNPRAAVPPSPMTTRAKPPMLLPPPRRASAACARWTRSVVVINRPHAGNGVRALLFRDISTAPTTAAAAYSPALPSAPPVLRRVDAVARHQYQRDVLYLVHRWIHPKSSKDRTTSSFLFMASWRDFLRTSFLHSTLAFSPSDWTYGEAVLKRRLGDNFYIYASSSNIYTRTFDGIDIAGRRLADEVLDVVRKMASLRKISFLAHSLGGLFARYAISMLYSPEMKSTGQSGAHVVLSTRESEKSQCTSGLGAIAGLEPINFITLATPHLGVRGRNQVGPQNPLHRSLNGYKHIVNVEYCSPILSEGPRFPTKAVRAKEVAQRTPNIENTEEYHKIMEEEMIHGLQKIGWKKVDVNFHSSFWPYSAHNNIHVKNRLHNAGAGVIAHVADSVKQQESRPCFPANL
ncbi:hypothetical protein PR202_ga18111 [Eleusine coracana subsp. coracana]|uniref:DUF676 domain-containing protein n=1 Tax=Eleusine coracana subsp. coracana TaxID=191504 RepID=A0AAV5CRU6_ELECO|nr:hypothetical protein PR202_ga18111 [Eleusine coracana subsp. coracana]